MLGRNVLLNFITGRYHRPRLEERVFLFIDMVGSTGIAERLGERALLSLLNRFVADLTAPIIAAREEIHRYVGDELIATWKLADGVVEARCVRACFAAVDRLAREAPTYQRDFGVAINARAGLHCGPVVTGEMGTVKKEIIFLGDTINTTARIQSFCRETGDPILASATLLAAPAVGDDYVYRTARGLYMDCAAGEGENRAVADEKHRHCAKYIGQIFNDWNLSQDIGICSQHFGSELREAYVDYWRARGLGFMSGIFLSADTSVREFLDSQTQPCPNPNPKADPL